MQEIMQNASFFVFFETLCVRIHIHYYYYDVFIAYSYNIIYK